MNKNTYACPSCGDRIIWSTNNAWRPFCSERCRMVDLSKWSSGEYSVPVSDSDEATDD